VHNRTKNSLITGAPAEISRQPFTNFLFGRMWMSLEQRHSRNDHTRSANSALRAAAFEEGRLHSAKFLTVRNAFNRANVRSIRFDRGNEAAVDDRSVQQNRASAAFALTATFFRSGEAHLFPQDIEQARHRIGRDTPLLAVDGASNLNPPGDLRQACPPY
jgi:hypothetical protein